jgi:arylsulfatase A-like enzyme
MQTLNRRDFLAALGCASLGMAAASPVQAAPSGKPRPNFVFFLIDDMGWMDVGCNGSRCYETPNIDRLASQGMRFTNAYAACPVCSPTRASILTGKYPARLHLTDWIPGQTMPYEKLRRPDFRQELPLEEVTIAEALKPAGYATASIGKWHLGTEPYYPEHQGFDVNFGGRHIGQPGSYFYPFKQRPDVPKVKDNEYITDRLTDEALKFIEANKDRPFFLYLPHYAVHTPLEGKEEEVERFEKKGLPREGQNSAVYAAMIKSVDESVGRVMARLDELGIADNTVVIFMSDNGGLARVTSNAPLRSGKGTLYEGGVREPMIVRWPGVVKPGSVCDTPVISVDFFPTILAMAGVPMTVDNIDGVDLTPLLHGGTAPAREALYWHYPHYHAGGATPGGAIREGDYKLIDYYGEERFELYELKADLGEQNDLAEKMPEKARELRRKLHDWLHKVDAQMHTPNPNYDPKKRDRTG